MIIDVQTRKYKVVEPSLKLAKIASRGVFYDVYWLAVKLLGNKFLNNSLYIDVNTSIVVDYLATFPFKHSPFFAVYMLLSYKNKCVLL